MKRRLNVLITIFPILTFALLFFGCATPKIPMQTRVEELSQVNKDHGVVVGSVLIKGPKPIFLAPQERWVIAKNASEYRSQGGKKYSIEVVSGEEKIFVTKMPAGDYYFTEHLWVDNHAYLDQRFTVHPGKTVYIGRLVITFYGRHLTQSADYSYRVQDAKEQTLAAAEQTYGSLVRNAVTDLMGKIKLPHIIEKVWYREEKLISFWHYPTGPLTIGKDALEFRSEEIQLTVPYASILDVHFGRLGTVSGIWLIVKYRAEGSEKIAAFMDTRCKEIYRTLKKAYGDYVASARK